MVIGETSFIGRGVVEFCDGSTFSKNIFMIYDIALLLLLKLEEIPNCIFVFHHIGGVVVQRNWSNLCLDHRWESPDFSSSSLGASGFVIVQWNLQKYFPSIKLHVCLGVGLEMLRCASQCRFNGGWTEKWLRVKIC